MHLSTVHGPCCAAVFKEVDKPLHLDMCKLCLSDEFLEGNSGHFRVMYEKGPIRAAAWDPTCTRLVLCTVSSHLYMWTPSGAYCVSNPQPHFNTTDLKWNSDGSCLILKDKESAMNDSEVFIWQREEKGRVVDRRVPIVLDTGAL
ncbi:hypothetical protein SADUNF_Sadunf01G0059200 [Salix dunnii]|uniref:Uncharacterized protein n=1 Tax=Salix dunnii TaxID=1413687 RepID=A0A835NA37_9ROSI|nr:hypothetical protein SADUNF_Sadunf01G0059200 [Salix dunnii]